MPMPNIMSLFTQTSQNQQQPPQQNPQNQPTPGNIPQNPTVTANPTNPNAPTPAGNNNNQQNQNQNQNQDVSPLDEFKGIWETPKPADQNTNPSGYFNLDPAKLGESVKKLDFSKSINPETLKKIAAGGEDAATAFAEAINSVGQQAFLQSTLMATKLFESGATKQGQQFKSELPGLLKQHSLGDSLRAENPMLSNPAVAPLISAMEQQFAAKYPNATSAELKQQAIKYLSSLGSIFNPQQQTTETKTVKQGEDWEKFFDVTGN